ncbi:SPFH domain-containing protein [Streptomyces sp. NPDC059398]|uniref:SPFH domain-containing protein n=1 Tax=Streptomyces sp. NPDC059398 TaxID=3346820 RepID=UPI00367574A2
MTETTAPGEHTEFGGRAVPAGPAGQEEESTGHTGQTGPAWSEGPAGGRPAMRRTSVIMNESTTEIPVHLLFRDDAPGAAATGARTVGRPAGHSGIPAGPKRGPARTDTRTQPAVRPAPPADPRLSERTGAALPGAVALLGGAAALSGCAAVLWKAGALPAPLASLLRLDTMPYGGVGPGAAGALAVLGALALFAFGGIGRGRVGQVWVLSLFGDYRGSVRRTGLVWTNPLVLRRRVDVRLRHWRSEPLPAVDADGTALRVVVLVVWRIKDTARATYAVGDHEAYLSEQTEAAMARVLSQLPADAFHEDGPTLRDSEAVGDALTRMLKAETYPVGIEVFSAQPTRIEYAPEVADAMRRSRVAAIDARHRETVLTSVVDAVDDTVTRLTARGLVELDVYERNALVRDLTVAFYSGRGGAAS